MKLAFSCLKCGSIKHEVKNIVIPEKYKDRIKVDFGLYYLKTCLNCGFTEMYSAKIANGDEKNEPFVFGY